jgi:mannosyltransferase
VISLARKSVAEAPAPTEPAPNRTRRWDPIAVAVLATAVSLAGAARPSLWFDEAATISASANRSLAQMFRMLGNIDAVHGCYYVIMQGWFALFPATEFWSRVPSGLAVGGAAAGVVVLTRHFSTRSVAVCAGAAFAILPRTTWAGIEARPYAFSAVAAVWLTVLFAAAVRRDGLARWGPYGLLLAASVLLNVFLVLMVVVHAAAMLVLAPKKLTVIRWAATSFVAAIAVTPFLVFTLGQIHQVFWISPIRSGTIHDVLVDQYFPRTDGFAIAAAVIIGTAVIGWLSGRAAHGIGTRRLAVIALAWMLLPTGVVVIYSALVKPVYFPRYLYFTAPGIAILLGVCIVAIATTGVRAAGVLIVLAAVAAPNYLLVQRGPYAKEGMDYSQVADLLTARAAPGDCLVMDNTIGWKPGPIRAMTAARPSAFRKLQDPGLGPSGASAGRLWDGHVAIWAVADRINRCGLLWTVSQYDSTRPGHETGANLPAGPAFAGAPAYRVTHRLGFRLVERWQFNFAQVVKASR